VQTTLLSEAIETQRAIRQFTSEPVPDEMVRTVLEAAIRAPSGGNRQPWHFVVIRDREIKRQLGLWYLDSWGKAIKPESKHLQPYRSGDKLGRGMPDIPVLILVCTEREAPGSAMGSTTRGSSIYPAVQNMMLAARGLGLGTVLTTMHTRYEAEVKQLLGIPDEYDTVALIPLGYPDTSKGERFSRGKRKPLSEVTSQDGWGAAWAGAQAGQAVS
jgi:nitroreductase